MRMDLDFDSFDESAWAETIAGASAIEVEDLDVFLSSRGSVINYFHVYNSTTTNRTEYDALILLRRQWKTGASVLADLKITNITFIPPLLPEWPEDNIRIPEQSPSASASVEIWVLALIFAIICCCLILLCVALFIWVRRKEKKAGEKKPDEAKAT